MAVVDSGSFSAAAERLNCVQSNVTARIRRLETGLGRPVFERGRGGARLTEFGRRLLAHAEDLLARFDAAERDLRDAAGAAAPLRLGAMETTAAARLPALLKSLRRQCAAAPVSLRTGPSAELLALVWERKLDAAFVAAPVDDDRFQSVPAFRETLAAAWPTGGDRAGPLLAFRSGCSYRAAAEAWLRASGEGVTDLIEMGTLEGILGCVEAGMGFAVAPKSAIRTFRGADGLTLAPLPAPFGLSETRLAWRRDHAPTAAHQTLARLLDDAARAP